MTAMHSYAATIPAIAGLMLSACAGGGDASHTLVSDTPLHLEQHLDIAEIQGSELPTDLLAPIEWRFDRPQPGWKGADPFPEAWIAVEPRQTEDAMRLSLTEAHRRPETGRLDGMIYVELPDQQLRDWGTVEIQARTSDAMHRIGLGFNYTETRP
jgi:hypothetical protein